MSDFFDGLLRSVQRDHIYCVFRYQYDYTRINFMDDTHNHLMIQLRSQLGISLNTQIHIQFLKQLYNQNNRQISEHVFDMSERLE